MLCIRTSGGFPLSIIAGEPDSRLPIRSIPGVPGLLECSCGGELLSVKYVTNCLLPSPHMRYVTESAALVLLLMLACSPAPEVIQWTLHWKNDGRWKLTGNNPSDRGFRVERVVIVFLDREGFSEGWDRRKDVTIPAFSKKTLHGFVPPEQRIDSSSYPFSNVHAAYLEFPNGKRVNPKTRRSSLF